VRIQRLRLFDFRNYHEWDVDPSPGITIFEGVNAIGKTNVIEAIQVTTTAESFRRPRWNELVRWGAKEARVELLAKGTSSQAEMSLTISQLGKRVYKVNGTARHRLSDVVGLVPAVTFTPGDLDLVKGPAEHRRTAIDGIGAQLWSVYAAVRKDHAKVVRHRNKVLRDGGERAQLAAWDEQVAVLGGRLYHYRSRLLQELTKHYTTIHTELAGGSKSEIVYEQRCGLKGADPEVGATEVAEAIMSELGRRYPEEAARGMTLVGPHRDDIRFTVDGKDARTFASQGQQRTIALAWKIAELRVVEKVSRRKPILLLDDVMSELDTTRRTALAGHVKNGIQTFVTTTNLSYFDQDILSQAKVVSI